MQQKQDGLKDCIALYPFSYLDFWFLKTKPNASDVFIPVIKLNPFRIRSILHFGILINVGKPKTLELVRSSLSITYIEDLIRKKHSVTHIDQQVAF